MRGGVAAAVAAAFSLAAAAPASAGTTAQQVADFSSSFFAGTGVEARQNIAVRQEGDKFHITIPAFEVTLPDIDSDQKDKTITRSVSERTFTLTPSGKFGEHQQYKLEPFDWTLISSFFRELLPTAKLTAGSFAGEILLVPELKLGSKQSARVSNLALELPRDIRLGVSSFVTDYSARATPGKKMNTSSKMEAKDIVLQTAFGRISVPVANAHSSSTGGDLTADEMLHFLTAQKVWSKLDIPSVSLATKEDGAPDLSLRLQTTSDFSPGVFTLSFLASDIKGGFFQFFVPPSFMPERIEMRLGLKGMDADKALALMRLIEKSKNAAPDSPEKAAVEAAVKQALDEIVPKVVFDIKEVEISNATAAVKLSGTFKNLSTAAPLTEKTDGNATLTVTNFDALSPAPAVDESACAAAKKEPGQPHAAEACAPRGGMLDGLRPYMTAQSRRTNQQGQTVDTFKILIKGTAVTINGLPAGG